MSTLVELQRASIRDAQRELDGKTLTRPALLRSDGRVTTYACDVAIDGYENPLRNVPIAQGNHELLYADAGAAVRLRRGDAGQFEITGFSKRAPGDFIRIPVTLRTGQIGTPVHAGLTSRPLTLAELGTVGPGFGQTPLGAVAVYRGGTLLEITA